MPPASSTPIRRALATALRSDTRLLLLLVVLLVPATVAAGCSHLPGEVPEADAGTPTDAAVEGTESDESFASDPASDRTERGQSPALEGGTEPHGTRIPFGGGSTLNGSHAEAGSVHVHQGSSAAEVESEPLPWSERTLQGLTLRQKVGQMLMPMVLGDFAPEGSERHDRVLEFIEENEIGGVIMSVGSPTDVAVKLNDLQEHTDLPLLVASDLENGPGFRFDGAVHLPGMVELGGATRFPPLMAVGATGNPEYAYEIGRVTAREARALGIHVPFAPVLDVNNNPQNPVINTRSFGEDPELVSEMGAAFVRGVQEHGAVATGKHFPGHGDTDTDSHYALPVISVSRDRLDQVELLPFQRAVDAGMGAVMTAHVSVPELTGLAGLPATLSGLVVTDVLRTGMGFDGLIFTDAMDMQAVERNYPRGEASVRAVEAGADVILMPPSVEEAQEAIVAAVWAGRIPEARIDRSVRRILSVKEDLGLHRRAEVPLQAVPRTVGIPEHRALAREVAEQSMTLLRNDRNLLPLLGTRSADVLSVTYRSPNDLLAGKHMDATLRDTYPRLRSERLDRNTPDAVYEELDRRAARTDLVVVSLHVNNVARRDRTVLPDELTDFIDSLERRGVPHIVVSFGNPYLISEIPDVQAYMLAWGGGEASQVAAAKALFGEVATLGRLPANIPPLFALGHGLRIGGLEERASAR